MAENKPMSVTMPQTQEETSFNLAEYTIKLRKALSEICTLQRKTFEKYVEAGGLLIEIKQHLPYGKWLPWLKQEEISPSKAELYMKIVKRPDLYREAGFNLANVRAKSQGLGISHDGRKAVEEAIMLGYKYREAIEWLSKEDKQDVGLISEIEAVISDTQRCLGLCPQCRAPKMEERNGDRICPLCGIAESDLIQQEVEEQQRRIAIEEQIRVVKQHPTYPWVKRLVINGNSNGGELHPDNWVMKRYGRGYDEIAQELGYERGIVPRIGRPPSYRMAADEQFKHDLQEGYKLCTELGLITRRSTRHRQSTVRIKLRKPNRTHQRTLAAVIQKWEALGKPEILLHDTVIADFEGYLRTLTIEQLRRVQRKLGGAWMWRKGVQPLCPIKRIRLGGQE